MKCKKHLALFLISTTFLVSILSNAAESTGLPKSKEWILLPYAFSSDSTGFAGGVSLMKVGLFQPKTTLVTTVFAGMPQDIITNGEKDKASFSGGFISFSNFKLPYTDRISFSFMGLKSYFPRTNYYIDGSNTSDKDDAFVTSGDSNFFLQLSHIHFRWEKD